LSLRLPLMLLLDLRTINAQYLFRRAHQTIYKKQIEFDEEMKKWLGRQTAECREFDVTTDKTQNVASALVQKNKRLLHVHMCLISVGAQATKFGCNRYSSIARACQPFPWLGRLSLAICETWIYCFQKEEGNQMDFKTNSCRCCGKSLPNELINFAIVKSSGVAEKELVCGRCANKYGMKPKKAKLTAGRRLTSRR
jgi:hypothetical protein